jgi:hypothetical protein
MKTPEEILRKHIPPPVNEGEVNDDMNILNAMREYAQHYIEATFVLPSDESIREMSKKFGQSMYFAETQEAEVGFSEGAKAMREYVKRIISK